MKITTATEARANFKTVLDQTIDDADITIIHRRDGENAVLMSESQYNSLIETLHLLSTPANARALERAIAQDKANQAVQRELLDAE
ncbi:type II toxin-antitoxin system Phd/YefM family antitoxin [Acinetobacter gerneri]|uniref:type II toxin-antitoxin system Phd/YefM family antitoxin n=1 Tax=Acinetobacter gerneri TaxID=202952 RepID=UPI0029369B3F|nr:type II toxin-antitoxin system Phd/YefM family antitoxin [Acinetobacter gerneri]MDV2442003.1 type II toxin-antitoxin system Phd/YefM family antitoxin [Acinetobacter gerneri]